MLPPCLQEAFLESSEEGTGLTPAHTWAQTPFLSPSSVSPCPLCDVCPPSDGQQLRLALIRHDCTHPRQPQHTAIPLIPTQQPLCVILITSGRHDHCHLHMACPTYSVTHNHFTVSTVSHITVMGPHTVKLSLLPSIRVAHLQCHTLCLKVPSVTLT